MNLTNASNMVSTTQEGGVVSSLNRQSRGSAQPLDVINENSDGDDEKDEDFERERCHTFSLLKKS